MARRSNHPNLPGRLTKAVAETLFGWKDVRQHDGELVGKKPDKLGRLRAAKVPEYAADTAHAYEIDERMGQLGKSAAYFKELEKIATANKLPADWARPEQRARAALKVLSVKGRKKQKAGKS